MVPASWNCDMLGVGGWGQKFHFFKAELLVLGVNVDGNDILFVYLFPAIFIFSGLELFLF